MINPVIAMDITEKIPFDNPIEYMLDSTTRKSNEKFTFPGSQPNFRCANNARILAPPREAPFINKMDKPRPAISPPVTAPIRLGSVKAGSK